MGTVMQKVAASDYGGNYMTGGDSWLGSAGTYIESGGTVTGAVTPKVAASSNGGSYTGQ